MNSLEELKKDVIGSWAAKSSNREATVLFRTVVNNLCDHAFKLGVEAAVEKIKNSDCVQYDGWCHCKNDASDLLASLK